VNSVDPWWCHILVTLICLVFSGDHLSYYPLVWKILGANLSYFSTTFYSSNPASWSFSNWFKIGRGHRCRLAWAWGTPTAILATRFICQIESIFLHFWAPQQQLKGHLLHFTFASWGFFYDRLSYRFSRLLWHYRSSTLATHRCLSVLCRCFPPSNQSKSTFSHQWLLRTCALPRFLADSSEPCNVYFIIL